MISAVLLIVAACLAMSLVLAAPGDEVCNTVCAGHDPNLNMHLPYPDDNTKFCHCGLDGNWEEDCPPGLVFDPQMQVCDWPEEK